MTQVANNRMTDQRIKVYRLTTLLLDATFELPTWWCIDEWSREAATAALERCQRLVRFVENSVRGFGDRMTSMSPHEGRFCSPRPCAGTVSATLTSSGTNFCHSPTEADDVPYSE